MCDDEEIRKGVLAFLRYLCGEPLSSSNEIACQTLFYNPKIPKITLEQFLNRIRRYSPASSATYVVSIVYLTRMVMKRGQGMITMNTIHRQLLVRSEFYFFFFFSDLDQKKYFTHFSLIYSVIIAAKYCDDLFEDNNFYAQVGGIPLREMNNLELEMLKYLDFDLQISQKEFRVFEKAIRNLSRGKPMEKILEPAKEPKIRQTILNIYQNEQIKVL
jgi:hypothetical protein